MRWSISSWLRYGSGPWDARSAFIRLAAFLQGKKVVLLDSDPALCAEVLACSDTKGTFLERLIATPAWHPIYSIESMDGARWEQLARDFKALMADLQWRHRVGPLTARHTEALVAEILGASPGDPEGGPEGSPAAVLDAEALARLVLRILYELLFDHPIEPADETLFHRASIEWRKEIAVKGRADPQVKAEFWSRLAVLVERSRFKEGLDRYRADPSCWLSLFAQPFLISPQINVGDIFVAVFSHLKADAALLSNTLAWAREADQARLQGVLLEAIRLHHPFPILERELRKDETLGGRRFAAGTQFVVLLDRFRQDPAFDPGRWLRSAEDNPHVGIPFAAGPRMCPGKPIASGLMVEILRLLLLGLPIDRICPERGHRYSGRHNDGTVTAGESGYQLGVFAGVLRRSREIGRRVARRPPAP